MKTKKNALEWLVFFVGLALIASCVGLLISQMRSGSSNARADLVISTDAPVSTSSGFLVPVTVENHGNATAADIEGEVSLTQGGETVETGEFVLPYAPAGSQRKAAVMFTRNPACCEVQSRVRGFVEP